MVSRASRCIQIIKTDYCNILEPEDFSSNARTDILDKYSRFHGKTEFSVWCNTPDVKYVNSFRDLIYDINPNHITCVYKKMFETAAVMNLLNADGYAIMDSVIDDRELSGSLSGVKGDFKTEGKFISYLHEVKDESNSCIYSGIGHTPTLPERKKTNTVSDIMGWEVCGTPHAAWNTGYQKLSSQEARDNSRKQAKPACFRALSPSLKMFPPVLRNSARVTPNGQKSRNGSAGGMANLSTRERSTRERANSRGSATPREKILEDSSHPSSSTGSVCSTPTSIGRLFGHYQQNSNHMDKYREEYTYQRLFETLTCGITPNSDGRVCLCRHPSCPGAVTSSNCINRWYPTQEQPGQGKCSTKEMSCITSGVPVPKRTPVLKRRPVAHKHRRPMPYVLQVPKLDDCPKKTTSIGFPRDWVPKVGFFATTLTVTNFNPRKALSTSGHKVNRNHAKESASSIVLGHGIESFSDHSCGQGCLSVANVTASYYRRLNQNIKGAE